MHPSLPLKKGIGNKCVKTVEHLRPCQTSMMKFFVKIVDNLKPLTIFTKKTLKINEKDSGKRACWLTHLMLLVSSIPLENIRKPEVLCFQGV